MADRNTPYVLEERRMLPMGFFAYVGPYSLRLMEGLGPPTNEGPPYLLGMSQTSHLAQQQRWALTVPQWTSFQLQGLLFPGRGFWHVYITVRTPFTHLWAYFHIPWGFIISEAKT